jgi:hypothetical protein
MVLLQLYGLKVGAAFERAEGVEERAGEAITPHPDGWWLGSNGYMMVVRIQEQKASDSSQ